MNTTRLLIVACLTAVLAPAAPALALGRSAYSMEILVDGAPLREHAARGTTYVEALEGREYSIRLTNNTAQRVAIALSVDGLNTIDAKVTAARDASKWILGPYQSITLDGWQTGAAVARRFYFTTETDSYGAWLGKTRNLGVISAAVFREHRPRPVPISEGMGGADAPSAESQRAPLESRSEAGRKTDKRAEAESDLSDDHAATGIGREVGNRVTRVRFDAEPSPAAMLDLRYEFRDTLVRLGVLPRPDPRCDDPIARRERARGFEGMEFAPDPYRPDCR